MCRHLAYLGEPCSPAELVFTAPHALLVQSYAPRDMRGGGSVNADGFGLGWYPDPGAPPQLYRRREPLWTDDTLSALAASVRTKAFVAAVRNGTTGMPVTEAAAAPFAEDGWLFSHNGVVRGWPQSMTGLAGRLDLGELLTLAAPTDSVLLWALLRARLRAGEEPLAAVSALVAEVEAAAPGSRLNFLLTDGETLVGTAWTHALSWRRTATGVVLASEPCDPDPTWQPVPERHAVRVTASGVEISALSGEPSPDAARSTEAPPPDAALSPGTPSLQSSPSPSLERSPAR
ncbi:ergothioneine biosynthesis protein EgtC [Amycolatopsis jiangsuensis]|uniref:Gamma-glutamyl-hercynylcysteine sulfoxide hydrolase n=1 Tax=Amycolatopsis jiangsuensis TaxID=1181879 RepID=A0A840IMU6_9PSEU|nr:ergothioneine biosynthesis protein EgtC [Amycolatopsis jiangsuensis]MBB4683666.1 glutamine amidotransferase [Amycolatopsis jiangsuensis]